MLTPLRDSCVISKDVNQRWHRCFTNSDMDIYILGPPTRSATSARTSSCTRMRSGGCSAERSTRPRCRRPTPSRRASSSALPTPARCSATAPPPTAAAAAAAEPTPTWLNGACAAQAALLQVNEHAESCCCSRQLCWKIAPVLTQVLMGLSVSKC